MKDQGKEWRRKIFEQREARRQARVARIARKRAESYLRYLQQVEWPGKSLLQLLPIIINCGNPLAGKIAIERIEFGERLSAEDSKFLQESKARLVEAERKECSSGLIGGKT